MEEESSLVVKLISVDGVAAKQVYKDGNHVFTVDDTFSDKQIDTIYDLGKQFFNAGYRDGISRVQKDLQVVIGLAQPEKQ